MQENTNNQTVHQGETISEPVELTQKSTSPLPPHHSFVRRNIKKLLLIFAVVLLLESLWAINFINSSKTASNSALIQPEIPENEAATKQPDLIPIATMYLDPGTNTVNLNNEFEIAVVINTADRKINGADSIITYDPTTLTVVDGYIDIPAVQVKPGNIYNSLLINSVDPLAGKITLTGSRLSKDTPPFQGIGNFAIIRFKAIQVGSSEVSLVFDPTIAKTSSVVEAETSANILTGTGNATIQITQ